MHKKVIILASLVVGLLIGASTLSVLAQSVWTAPTAPPPGNNTPAPINVGNLLQTKIGGLWLESGLRVDGNVLIGTSSPSWGKVLMATDRDGTATWVATSSLGLNGNSTNIVYSQYLLPGNAHRNATDGTPTVASQWYSDSPIPPENIGPKSPYLDRIMNIGNHKFCAIGGYAQADNGSCRVYPNNVGSWTLRSNFYSTDAAVDCIAICMDFN